MCSECGEVVDYRDIAKAYESDDGRMVVITDDDIASLPEERSREIEVLEPSPATDIDPLMYDRSYYLEPDGKSTKSYAAGEDARGDRPGRDRALRAAEQDATGGTAGQGIRRRRRSAHGDGGAHTAVAGRDP